jgi:SlyX protein
MEKLELKVAFLERAQQELSDLVYAQRRELDRLAARLTTLLDGLQEVESDAGQFDPDAERPPHY